ncbi:hypothetical protein [Nocardioides sp. YIM 152588]|uniref:hypothetical protein n=1 Tax=Nocardioides sp. YIM 152588 TaxID=3158259 RepID=UPI0032E3911F
METSIDGTEGAGRKPRRRALLVGLALAVAIGVLGSGYTLLRRSPNGPLDTHTGAGGISIYGPERARYRATFGSIIPCVEKGGSIEITDVTYDYSVPARRTELWVRTFDVPAQNPKRAINSGVLTNPLGSPPRFDEPYADGPYPGTFTRAELPLTITDTCEELDALHDQMAEGRAAGPFTELLVSMKVDGGASLESVRFDYEAGLRKYYLVTAWQYVACGDRIQDHDGCRGRRQRSP